MIKSSSPLCLVVEDHPQTRDFISRTVMNSFEHIQVITVGSLKSAREWLLARSTEKNAAPLFLALVDLGLPDGHGIELLRELQTQEPQTPSVVITIYNDDSRLFEALSAGASGYILKDEHPELLGKTLQRIQWGEPPLSPSIARRMMQHFHQPKTPSQKISTTLTARELETLALIAQGLTVSETAQQLGLSAQTVASYVKNIYQKLHISSRAEATQEALRLGLLKNP